MIQRLNSQVNFTSTQMLSNPESNNSNAASENQTPVKKLSATDNFKKIKKATTDIIKDVNTVTGTGNGIVRGVAEGAILTGGVALIGKAVAEAKDQKGLKVLTTIAKNVVSDCWNAIKGAGSWAKRVISEDKALYKHFGEILSLPKKFYTNYLKSHKAIAGIATGVGLLVLAVRTLQGKIYANEKNANIDHKTKQGHI